MQRSRPRTGERTMAIRLNRAAFDFAKKLVVAERVVFDERDAWSEHRPSAQTENEFLAAHGFREYAKWYLGIRWPFSPSFKKKCFSPARWGSAMTSRKSIRASSF